MFAFVLHAGMQWQRIVPDFKSLTKSGRFILYNVIKEGHPARDLINKTLNTLWYDNRLYESRWVSIISPHKNGIRLLLRIFRDNAVKPGKKVINNSRATT